jgi:hypothetical protein
VTAILILASVVDLGLAVLLVAVSGFIFESGGGLGGSPSDVAMWSGALLVSVAAPIAGFVLRARGLTGAGAAVAAAPPIIGALLWQIAGTM